MGSKLSGEKTLELNYATKKISYCYVCNIEADHQIHGKDQEHLLKLDYFSTYFSEECEELVKCSICFKDITKNNAHEHAIQHKLVPWYRPENEFQEYFLNFIALNNGKYWCYLCGKEMQFWFQALSHLTNTDHRLHMAKIDKEIPSKSLSFDLYQKCVLHSIFPFSVTEMKCFICDCLIREGDNIEKHISTEKHNESHFSFKPIDKNMLSQITGNGIVQLPERQKYLLYFKNFIKMSKKNEHWCYLCNEQFSNWDVAIDHIENPKHQSALKTPIKDEHIDTSLSLNFYQKSIRHSIFPKSFNELKCIICNCYIPGYRNINTHISGKYHQKEYQVSLQCTSTHLYSVFFKNYVGTIERMYRCYVCAEFFKKIRKAISHIQKSSHNLLLKNVDSTSSEVILPSDYQLFIKNGIFASSVHGLKCFMCDISLPEYSIVNQHICSKKHQNSYNLFRHDGQLSLSEVHNSTKSNKTSIQFFNNFIGFMKNQYWCFLCNQKYDDYKAAITHINNPNHQDKIINNQIVSRNLSRQFYEYCIKNGIFPISFEKVRCYICKKSIHYFKTIQHSATERHFKNITTFKTQFNQSSSKINTSNHSNVGKELPQSNLSPVKTCHNEKRSNENSSDNSNNKKDVSDPREIITKSDDQGKIITTLEIKPLNNKTIDAKVVTSNSTQNICIDKPDNETDNGWILINSMNNRAKIKKPSSKATKRKRSKASKESRKKRSNTNRKNVETVKPRLNRSSVQKTEKATIFQVSKYRMFLVCFICKEKFQSEVVLHAHLTSHLWPRFIQHDGCREEASNLPSQYCQLNNNENQEKSQSISNLNSEILNQKKQHDVKATYKIKQNKGVMSRGNYNSRGSGQLHAKDKLKCKKHLVKAADILQPDETRDIDIYKIDPIQLKMINLSITRCYPLNAETIYCLICREKISNSVRTVYEHFGSINHNDYLLEMIQDHIKLMSFPDHLSDLSLARDWMEDISDEFVECYTCQKTLTNDLSVLKDHLDEKNHQYQRAQVALTMDQFSKSLYSKMERNWYKVNSYWCVPCCKKYVLENQFYKHINTNGSKKNKHVKKCQRFSEFTNFIFDYCPTCATLFYGFRSTFAYHCEIEKHKYFQKKIFYTVDQLPSVVEKMLLEPDAIVNKMINSLDANDQKRQEDERSIIDDLETIVNHFLPAKAYLFGSRASGLSSGTSDLDIFLDCEDRYYDGRKSDDVTYILEKVEESLRSCTAIWTVNRSIVNCNVPIIKVTHKLFAIECDISVLNGLTTESSQLIKAINQKFPLCRKLILFVKQWINICNLSGEKGVNNYAIAWMVIYYLQTKSIIKPIITLIIDRNESKMIGGWETGASLDFSIPESNESFKDLLKGFFEMITTFDFRNNIICPLLGKPLEKIQFSDAERLLPGEMETYKQDCTRKDHEMFRIDSPLCVQDPYDLTHNITKATKKLSVSKLIAFSTFTVKKLESENVCSN